MFDWFWEFLYGISKSIFRLIDGLMACANKLCGIEPIEVYGEETNFMDYLMEHGRILTAFYVSAFIGIILLGAFSVYMIVKSTVSDKGGMSPAQVCIKAAKTVGMFLLVPMCMTLLIMFVNIFVNALYAATLGGSGDGLGRFLCGAFSQDALLPTTESTFYLQSGFDYTDTDALWNYIDVSDFDFFFSWVAGICILFALAKSLLEFVDRAISVVFLFIVSPISMSTTVIDDGAHFKLWRDQLLVKFLSGYGCIIGINVYTLIITIICDKEVVFFDSGFLNNLFKIAFIVGGAVSLQRVQALAGNLISAGAGTNQMRELEQANGGFRSAVGSMARAATSPFRAARSVANFASDAKQYGLGGTIGNRLGFKTARDYGAKSKLQKDEEAANSQRSSESTNHNNQTLANMIGEKVSEAITGKKNDNNDNNKKQENNNHKGNKNNNTVANAIDKLGDLANSIGNRK